MAQLNSILPPGILDIAIDTVGYHLIMMASFSCSELGRLSLIDAACADACSQLCMKGAQLAFTWFPGFV
jgi:hypothetical protein